MILKVILSIYLLTVITCLIRVSIQVCRFNTCMNMLENGQSNKMKLYDRIISILTIIVVSIIPFYNIFLIIGSFALSKEEILEHAIEQKLKNLK